MISLTVGYVSGIIAAGIHVIQFLIPDAVALILAGITHDEQSAITWSVVGQALQTSHWPAILNSDSSAAGRGNRKSVQFTAWLRPIGLLLVTVAAIVTPLGLYETIAPDKSPVHVSFHYVKDASPFGLGTPSRSSLGFGRKCGDLLPQACPGTSGTSVEIMYSSNETSASADLPDSYNTNIPPNITAFFQSGLETLEATVSSIFDIQWRSYTTMIDERINNGTRYVLGSYRQLTSMVLDDAIEPLEGLLMVGNVFYSTMADYYARQDTKNGGIGFRNHTVPGSLPHGATWSEDLLFIEPETVCVDTNLTLDFYIPETTRSSEISKTLVLTDHGGFANLDEHYPYYDRNDTQVNPDLWGRAYKAAWMNNAWTMMYLNVTRPNPGAFSYVDSEVGKQFSIGDGFTSISYNALKVSDDYGNYLDLPWGYPNESLLPKTSGGTDVKAWANPFNVTHENFTDIGLICRGAGGQDQANISNIAVGCGLVQGAARFQNGQKSLIFDRGSNWTVPLYSCASAVKADIKTVNFRYDGAQGLKGLTMTNITNKIYSSETDKPLWAVENMNMSLADAPPLWGIVSGATRGYEGYTYLRSDHLYLPGYTMGSLSGVGHQNLAGVDFHSEALVSAYDVGGSAIGVQDYSGQSDFAMFARWQELSSLPQTTAKIINLIWTDLAGNAVVGTRSWLTPKPDPFKPATQNETGPNDGELHSAKRDLSRRETDPAFFADAHSASVPVQVYNQRIRYHWPFAIPAFLVCLIAGLIFAAALLFALFGRIERLRQYTFQLSAGRLMGNFIYPDECAPLAPTRIWRRNVGVKRVKVGVYTLEARDHVLFPPRQSSAQGVQEPLMAEEYMDGKMCASVGTRPVHSPALVPGPLTPHAYGSAENVHNGYHGVPEDYRI
ncbi:MAG: hypothetical protein Q9160_003954 [Pyrenula sp. 1 TL-2023]